MGFGNDFEIAFIFYFLNISIKCMNHLILTIEF